MASVKVGPRILSRPSAMPQPILQLAPSMHMPVQPQQIKIMAPIKAPAKLPLTNGVVVHAAAAPIVPPPVPLPMPPAPVAQVTQGPSQLQLALQQSMEQIRVRLDAIERKLESKIEQTVRECLTSGLKDLKVQFETTEVLGELLVSNLPVFNRPDIKTSIETKLGAKGTRVKLFHPVITNEQGYWMSTSWASSNGSVLTGYVPVFSAKLDGVAYEMTDAEMQARKTKWEGHLDQLSDKMFVTNVGRFIVPL